MAWYRKCPLASVGWLFPLTFLLFLLTVPARGEVDKIKLEISDFSSLASAVREKIHGNVVDITDLNFDSLVNSTKDWMIEVYSPWCKACKELEPIWSRVAVKSKDAGYMVGRIHALNNRALVYRFQVTVLPTIFHIKNGEVREYEGVKSVNSLHDFAVEGWKTVKPSLQGCASPVSLCGRIFGNAITSPQRMKESLFKARKTFKYGDVTLLAMILGAPVCAGLSVICMLDYIVTHRKHQL